MAELPTSNWYPDPSGRCDHRYWDGAAWTAHVSSAGVAGLDALRPGETLLPPSESDAYRGRWLHSRRRHRSLFHRTQLSRYEE